MIVTDKVIAISGGCTVALGTFDGVHLGHRAVINAAREFGLPVVVVTSAQNPQSILGQVKKSRISSAECNDRIFADIGVSAVIRFDFEDIRSLSPDEYLDILVDQIGAKNIVFGFNFRFGRCASGDAQTAHDYCEKRGIGLKVCDEVCVEGDTVSSTRIRACIEAGDMQLAKRLLGRAYSVDFEVVHGDGRGRTMMIPTANQEFADDYVLPRFGVYASRTLIGGKTYASVTNIGVRPTFLSPVVLAETYVDGFDGSLYGEKPTVELTEFIRGERKFESIEQLRQQILLDIEKSKA